MENNEGCAVACREGRDGLKNTILSAWGFPARKVRCMRITNEPNDLRCITGQEVVARLLRSKLANGWQYTESITGQHNNVGGLTINHARNLSVGNKLDRIGTSCVLRNADVVVVGNSRNRVINDVLEDTAISDGVKDVGFLFSRKVDTLGIASTLDVENTSVRPNMLVVTDEETVRISGKSSFSGS